MKTFPIPSIQRLPVYLRFLKGQQAKGDQVVSCTRIAEEFGQLSVQVRKDLSITGITGRPKVGYRISELTEAIESFLGWNGRTTAFLIGAGSLGSAILGYEGFSEHGLSIIAAFDNNRGKIGTRIHGCPVYEINAIFECASGLNVDIGILTVPAAAAQSAADLLVKVGVRAIWNYTPRRLELPKSIVCEDVKLSASFAVLTSRMKNLAE